MQTTIDIPDSIYPALLAASTAQGQSVSAFLVQAAAEKAKREGANGDSLGTPVVKRGWRVAFGSADPEDVAEVQKIIDEEFSKIDPEDWK